MQLRPDFTFDRFVRGPGCGEALDACKALAKPGLMTHGMLFLSGSTGVGKTHLLHSIAHAVLKRHPEARLFRTAAIDLAHKLVEGIRHDRLSSVRQEYRKLQVLLVDDFHVLASLPFTQSEVAVILKSSAESGVRVACAGIIASQVQVLSRVLRFPLSSLLVAVKQPTPPEMRRILMSKLTKSELKVFEKHLNVIARRCRGDVGRAIGALAELRFSSSVQTG